MTWSPACLESLTNCLTRQLTGQVLHLENAEGLKEFKCSNGRSISLLGKSLAWKNYTALFQPQMALMGRNAVFCSFLNCKQAFQHEWEKVKYQGDFSIVFPAVV